MVVPPQIFNIYRAPAILPDFYVANHQSAWNQGWLFPCNGMEASLQHDGSERKAEPMELELDYPERMDI